MNIRRVAVTGVAVFALAATLAGCAKEDRVDPATNSAAAASATPSRAPKDALLTSAKRLTTATYKFTLTEGTLTGTGSADGSNAAIHAAISGQEQNTAIKMDLIVINTDVYVQMDFGQLNGTLGIQPDKYLHMDGTKLGANGTLPLGTSQEPVDAAGLLAGVVDVKSTDGKSFTGTVDLTKATGDNAPEADLLQKAGDKAKSVPFTAKVDDQGRLTELKIDGSSIDPGLVFAATFSDYGKAANVTAPDDAQVVEAPDSVQKLFQSS